MIRTFAGSIVFLALSSFAAAAQEEPWGGNVPGWRFTQTAEAGDAVNCRAVQGQNLISRSNKGRNYLSVPAPAGLPKGWYKEGRASIVIGATAEPVDAEITGRLVLYIDDGLYPELVRARGYQWRLAGPAGIVTGSVSFSGDLAKVVAEVRACAKANTVAAPTRPAAPAASDVVSFYTRSNGNLCLGAVTGMLNVGLVTTCSKPPARIRIDAGARRILAGDKPQLCLGFLLGTFAEMSDLQVAPCDRVKSPLSYDSASGQIRSDANQCLGIDGAVQEFAKLKMQPCSPTATGQKWVLGNTVAKPLN